MRRRRLTRGLRRRSLPGRFVFQTSSTISFGKTGGFAGSNGYVDRLVLEELEAMGGTDLATPALPDWDVTSGTRGTRRPGPPVRDAAVLAANLAARPDLVVACDAGLSGWMPSPAPSRRLAVLFHGLLHLPGLWLASTTIDGFWANSPYVADVLRALFLTPDLASRTLLNPGAARKVAALVLPVPLLEHPRGYKSTAGVNVPAEVDRLLERGDAVIGHALVSNKLDVVATAAIALLLGDTLAERGRGFRLLVPDESVAALRGVAEALAPGGVRDDLFVALPWLKNTEVARIMRRADLALLYQRVPEGFGFYAPESLLSGCPVYTNGAGNLRHQLPADHGIVVDEAPGMTSGAFTRCGRIARRIADDVLSGAGKAAAARGAALVRQRFTRPALRNSLRVALDRLDARVRAPRFEDTRLGWHPLVRQVVGRRVIADHGELSMTASQRALVERLLGRSVETAARLPAKDRAIAQRLIANGLLAATL